MAAQESFINEGLQSLVGVESESRTHDVERGAIVRFAEAIGDPNPIYRDEIQARRSRYGGIIAPPTFLRSMRPGPWRVEIKNPFQRNLDGGSEWEFFEPIRPGDRITVTIKLADVLQRKGRLGPMIFMTLETSYANQLGQMVAIQRSTSISY